MRPIEVIQLVRGLSAFMNELHKPNPLLLMDKELENLLNVSLLLFVSGMADEAFLSEI